MVKKEFIILFIFIFTSGFLYSESGVSFNGSGSFSVSSSKLDIHSGNATGLTIEFWMRASSNNTGWRNLLSRGSQYSISFWDNQFRVNTAGTSWPDLYMVLPPNVWYHVTLMFGGGYARLFVNGCQLHAVQCPLPSSEPSATFSLGANSFIGVIDEVRISKIARYTSAFIPSSTPFTSDSDTAGLWHLDEGAGTTAGDSSSNPVTATISGGTWVGGVFTTKTFRQPYNVPKIDPSPFGISIHHWNTRSLELTRWPRKPYDDGINDGYTNSKIFQYIPYIGARWIRDYGQSDGGGYYWPLDETNPDITRRGKGYGYMDSYVLTLRDFGNLSALHVNIGFSSEDNLRGKAPDDWTKFFNLEKEIHTRYLNSGIQIVRAGHEIDNTDSGRWTDTLQNYVRYLKYTHDAVKSVSQNIQVQIGDFARPTGGASWNNGQFYYSDGMLNYVDESTLDKILYEITTNGTNSIYNTTALGGFPGSTNPLDFFDAGIGVTCYAGAPGGGAYSDYSWFNTNIDYVFGILLKYDIKNWIDIQIQETSALTSTPSSDTEANAIVPNWRYLFRSNRVGKAFFFHYDGISWSPSDNSQEVSTVMIDFDANRDGVGDTNITLYPVAYAYKKMTHLVYPNYEQFDNDVFLETGGTKFYNTGWFINNISNWSISNSQFTGTTQSGANMYFRDLVLPTYRWRIWGRYDWQNFAMNRYFVVKMRSNQSGTAKLYWDNVSWNYGTHDFSNTANSASISITGDGTFREYTVDLSQNPNWTGVVSAVRFDPLDVSGANIAIDYLGFTDSIGPSGATKLSVTASPSTLPANGTSISTITATVQDNAGNRVTTSTATIRFTLTGSGTLVGTNPVIASAGIATIQYRAGTSQGTVTITATSSGLTDGSTQISLTETTPPATVQDLQVTNRTQTSITLSWTAPGDDGNTGTASMYDIRYALSQITNEAQFNSATECSNEPTPKPAGQTETFVVNGLAPGTTYYFALKTRDDAGNWSGISNSPQGVTLGQSVTPTITVLSPNGGQVWDVATTQTVTWTWTGAVGSVNIDLSTNGGNSWTNLVSNTGNDGNQTVIVPQTPSTSCRIRVAETDGTPQDISDSNFTITAGNNPVLKVSVSSLDFGEIPIGETATESFEISNIGGATLYGNISDDSDWIEVTPTTFEGQSVTVYVTVDNEVLNQREGMYQGKVYIESNGGNATVDIIFSATCVLVKPNPVKAGEDLVFFGNGIVPEKTKIKIYTVSGENIAELNAGKTDKEIIWNTGKLSPGVYVYTYETPKEKGTGKFTCIK